MLKLYVNREPIHAPWGGGNMFARALYAHAEKFDVQIIRASDRSTSPDVCLLIGLEPDGYTNAPGLDSLVRYQMLRNEELSNPLSLILRCNENDAHKMTNHVDDLWREAFKYVNGVVFVSDYLADYYNASKESLNHTIIRNGVDKNIFKQGTLIDNQKNNIVTHHWNNNALKGFDIYEKLDKWVGENSDKWTFTYIGRDRGTFKNTKVIKPLFNQELANELGKYDVYVSASRAEPGPNHVLESLACGMPTFVKRDGGAAVEFVEHNQQLVYNDFEELITKLNASSWPVLDSKILIDWPTCIEKYCDYIKEVHKNVRNNA